MAKVADVLPGATETEIGTDAWEELLESPTIAPLGPAGPSRVTVPVLLTPPWTVVGDRVSEASTAGVIVSVVFRVLPK